MPSCSLLAFTVRISMLPISYNDVGKKLNLVYSEQRTMHSGVVLARSNSPSSGGSGISSDLNSDRSLAANNRILVVDRRNGN